MSKESWEEEHMRESKEKAEEMKANTKYSNNCTRKNCNCFNNAIDKFVIGWIIGLVFCLLLMIYFYNTR